MSKVLEQAAARSLRSYNDDNQLQPPKQSAYRRFYSTETAVVSIHIDNVRAIDSGLVTGLVLLDPLLLLTSLTIPFYFSYLTDASVSPTLVLLGSTRILLDARILFLFAYTQTAVEHGVPQGFVLGPLQFIRYVADVIQVFDSHGLGHYLFADDKEVYARDVISEADVVRRRLPDFITNMSLWCASFGLQLNGIKSDLIWFATPSNHLNLANQDLFITVGTDTVTPFKAGETWTFSSTASSVRSNTSLILHARVFLISIACTKSTDTLVNKSGI